jgi:hypothetical protein
MRSLLLTAGSPRNYAWANRVLSAPTCTPQGQASWAGTVRTGSGHRTYGVRPFEVRSELEANRGLRKLREWQSTSTIQFVMRVAGQPDNYGFEMLSYAWTKLNS